MLQLPGEIWKKALIYVAGGNHEFDGWEETQSWQSHKDVLDSLPCASDVYVLKLSSYQSALENA